MPGLMDMPLIFKEELVMYSGYGREALARSCTEFRDLSNTLPYHYEEIKIYIGDENQVNARADCERVAWHTGDHDTTAEFFKRFANPRNTVEELNISSSDEHLDAALAKIFTEVEDGTMAVEKLVFRTWFNQQALVNVLRKLKPGYLKTISITNTDRPETFSLRNVVDLEQWKQAIEFASHCGNTELAAHEFVHFETFGNVLRAGIEVKRLSTEDVSFLLEKYKESKGNRCVHIDGQLFDTNALILAIQLVPDTEHRIHENLYFEYASDYLRFYDSSEKRRYNKRKEAVANNRREAAQREAAQREAAERAPAERASSERASSERASSERASSERAPARPAAQQKPRAKKRGRGRPLAVMCPPKSKKSKQAAAPASSNGAGTRASTSSSRASTRAAAPSGRASTRAAATAPSSRASTRAAAPSGRASTRAAAPSSGTNGGGAERRSSRLADAPAVNYRV